MRHGARRNDREYEQNVRDMARRAGMSVREWLDAYGPEPKYTPRDYDALAERLESLADRFERPLRSDPIGRGRVDDDLLRAMDAVSRLAELSERQARQVETGKLDEWPQRMPTAQVEDAQKPVLEALKSVEKRLAAIEEAKAPVRETIASPLAVDPAMAMMAEALRAIGHRFDSLENRHTADVPTDPRIHELSSRIDGMRSAIAAASNASTTPPPAFESNVSRTINEITSRQRALDGGKSHLSGAGSANKAFSLFDNRLQDLTRTLADARSPAPLVFDTSRIEQQIGELAQQIAAVNQTGPAASPAKSDDLAAIAKLEEKINSLSQQIATQRQEENPGSSSATAKLEAQLGELVSKIDQLGQKPQSAPLDPVAGRIEQQLAVLAEKLESLNQSGNAPIANQISASHIDGLTGRIDALRSEIMAREVPHYNEELTDLKQDITSLMMNMQGLSSQKALQELTDEIHGLRDRVDQSRRQGLSAGEADHLENLTHELQSALQNVRSTDTMSGVEASIRAISDRLDYLNGSARVDEGVINQLAGNLERLTQRVEELGQNIVAPAPKAQDSNLSDILQGLIDRLDQQRSGPDMSEALRSIQERLDQSPREQDLPAETVEKLAERVATETAGRLDNVNAMLDRLSRRIDEIGEAKAIQPPPQAAPRNRAPQRIVMPSPKAAEPAEHVASTSAADVSSVLELTAPQAMREPGTVPAPVPDVPTGMKRTRSLVSERPVPAGEGDLPIDPGAERPAWRAQRDGMRNNYLNAAREAAIAAAEEAEARTDNGRSSRSASDIFDQEEKTGLKARISGLFKRKPKAEAPSPVDEDDSLEPRIVEPRRSMSGNDINLTPENAGLQAQITNRRKPILVGIAVVLIMLMGLQILPGVVNTYVTKLRDASIAKKEQLTAPPQPETVKPPESAPPATPQQQSQVSPRVIEASPSSNEITGSLPKSGGTPETLTATGRVMAPPGITISGGWANETGPMAKPVIDGKVPNNLVAAAEKGIPEAAYELGSRYLEGRGVGLSVREAAQWYERSAQAGYAPAQFRLGSMYEKGNGVARDLVKAKAYYEQAAGQGNAKAMHNLAVIHAEGIEGKPDYKGAAAWFLRGAEYGIVDSQYNLAILYARGLGVETNLAESYKWFALAADGGDKDAAKKREDVASRLDGQTLATAKLAAQTFFVKKEPEGVSDASAGSNPWTSSPLTTSSTSKKAKPAGAAPTR